MSISPELFPEIINKIIDTISRNAESVTELDQAIGDGDHVFNLQRGLQALHDQSAEISALSWPAAWQKIGMTLMSTVGGASGSLYATLFISLAKNAQNIHQDLANFARIFGLAIEAVKQRGKADVGEKTMLDVLAPVANALNETVRADKALLEILQHIRQTAETGVEATRDMLATKGRASFLGERSKGHIDPGAKTAQLMIEAVAEVLQNHLTSPNAKQQY
jgi:dihydroxyacetone kinase-like protein